MCRLSLCAFLCVTVHVSDSAVARHGGLETHKDVHAFDDACLEACCGVCAAVVGRFHRLHLLHA